MRKFELQVSEGIQFLKATAPNYREKLDEGKIRFDMRNPCGCVVGLITGDYYVGTKIWGIDSLANDATAIKLGFWAPFDPSHQFSSGDWDGLEQEWKRQLWGEE